MQLQLKDYLTLANAASGFLALFAFFKFGYFASAFLVLLAVVFDFLDGIVARKTNSHDELGKQLDSLADAVSFVAAPAFVVAFLHSASLLVLLSCVFFVFAGLLRLAKFNVQKEKGVYFGLPTPFAALLLVAFGWIGVLVAAIAALVLGLLMLSSFKLKKVF